MVIPKEEREKNEVAIQKLFTGKDEIGIESFEEVCDELLRIPKIFSSMLFHRMKLLLKLHADDDKISKQTFITIWKKVFEKETVGKRVFKLIAKPESTVLEGDDFKPLFKHLLETHQGLHFLKDTPEF